MSKQDWWRGGVIYQIYPRSFMDTTGNGVGDLKGITSKLDHVASLGVDAIWISPFMKSPMKDFGYDVSDYKSVDPLFGTLDDFKILLNRAHDLNLKVLIDMVWSHSSDQHEWFKTSKSSRENSKSDWYVWADAKADGTAPNNWLSWFGGPAWTWDPKRRQYYLHHFLKEQPALNLWNPDVRAAIKDTAAFWLDMGVDGFRLDVSNMYLADKHLRDNPARPKDEPLPFDTPESNPVIHQIRKYSVSQPENLDLIAELRSFVDQWADRCLLAETGCCEDAAQVAASYTQKNKRFHQAYSFDLLASDMSKDHIVRTIRHTEDIIEDGWTCWATSNHDFTRPVTRINPPKNLEKNAALLNMAFALSLRGSYCMFQGEELGLPQAELTFEELQDPYDKSLYPEHAGRDGTRTPVPWNSTLNNAGFSDGSTTWLPIRSEHKALAVDTQESDPHSVLNRYRNFIDFRKNSDILRRGSINLVEAPGDILVFERKLGEEILICMYNISANKNSIELTSLNYGHHSVLENISEGATLSGLHLSFEPYGYAFLK